jgi:hypothetical protein
VAVQILSPREDVEDLRAKCQWYVEHGAQVAMLVDPGERSVTLFQSVGHVESLCLDLSWRSRTPPLFWMSEAPTSATSSTRVRAQHPGTLERRQPEAYAAHIEAGLDQELPAGLRTGVGGARLALVVCDRLSDHSSSGPPGLERGRHSVQAKPELQCTFGKRAAGHARSSSELPGRPRLSRDLVGGSMRLSRGCAKDAHKRSSLSTGVAVARCSAPGACRATSAPQIQGHTGINGL